MADREGKTPRLQTAFRIQRLLLWVCALGLALSVGEAGFDWKHSLPLWLLLASPWMVLAAALVMPTLDRLRSRSKSDLAWVVGLVTVAALALIPLL